jgi:hypothetical protein
MSEIPRQISLEQSSYTKTNERQESEQILSRAEYHWEKLG